MVGQRAHARVRRCAGLLLALSAVTASLVLVGLATPARAQVSQYSAGQNDVIKKFYASPSMEAKLAILVAAKDTVSIMELRTILFKTVSFEQKFKMMGWGTYRGKTDGDLVKLLLTKHIYGPDVQLPAPYDITPENFDSLVLSGRAPRQAAFIKFFAPWCGHCKQMKPAWEELGANYFESRSLVVGSCDCTTAREVCTTVGVSSYPTLLVWAAGSTSAEPYEGDRDELSMSLHAQSLVK